MNFIKNDFVLLHLLCGLLNVHLLRHISVFRPWALAERNPGREEDVETDVRWLSILASFLKMENIKME